MNDQRTPLSVSWASYNRTPFPLLVRLFIKRIFYGTNSDEYELGSSMGLVLALLALPGGFISMFLFNKYGSLLQWLRGQTHFDALSAALPDEYFFIVLSMIVTGGVAIWWWESIFPDRRDFANLVHLPLSTSRIFVANAVAILLLALLLAIDVNGASCVLYPAVVGAAQPTLSFVIRFGAVHALAVGLASLFSFFAVFATVGLLLLVLPYSVFLRISLYVRSAIVLCFLGTLASSFAVPSMILSLPRAPDSLLRWMPPVWFLGFCQSLHGRADQTLTSIGHRAIVGVLCALILALLTYALSYRRCFSRLPELAEAPPGHLGLKTLWIFRGMDLLTLRGPFQRGGYRFVLKTLFRNEKHALAFCGFAGSGMLLASQALFAAPDTKNLNAFPSKELLSVPLIVSYSLLLGIRFILEIPASLRANWIFRLLLDKQTDEPVALARRIMLGFVLSWVFLIMFPIYFHFWGWRVAAFHTTIVALWSVLLTDVLLSRYRKLPFTCSYPAFQHSTVVNVIEYALGFFVFVGLTAASEADAFSKPATGVGLIVLALVAWAIVRRFRRGIIAIDKELVFEDIPSSGFEFLHLDRLDIG